MNKRKGNVNINNKIKSCTSCPGDGVRMGESLPFGVVVHQCEFLEVALNPAEEFSLSPGFLILAMRVLISSPN